jgi:hypothetical protein
MHYLQAIRGTQKTVRVASRFAFPDYRSARLTHLELWILFQNKECRLDKQQQHQIKYGVWISGFVINLFSRALLKPIHINSAAKPPASIGMNQGEALAHSGEADLDRTIRFNGPIAERFFSGPGGMRLKIQTDPQMGYMPQF